MSRPIKIPVKLDTTQAKKDVKLFNQDLGSAFNAIKGMSVGAVAGIAALGGALAGLASEASKAWELSKKQEGLEKELELALKQRSGNYKTLTEDLIAYNGAIEANTNIDADALAGVQKKMLLMGVLPQNIKAATQATAGLTILTGDLATSAEKVSQVINGKTNALKKYGIVGKDAADVLRQLAEMNELNAEKMETMESKLSAITAAHENFLKAGGRLVSDSPALKKAFDMMRASIDMLTTSIIKNRNGWGLWVEAFAARVQDIVLLTNYGAQGLTILSNIIGDLFDPDEASVQARQSVLDDLTSMVMKLEDLKDNKITIQDLIPEMPSEPEPFEEQENTIGKQEKTKTFDELADKALSRAAKAQSELNAAKKEEFDLSMERLKAQEQASILDQKIEQQKQDLHIANLTRIDELMEKERAANTNRKSLWENAFGEGSKFMERMKQVAENTSDIVGSIAESVVGGFAQMFTGLGVLIGNAIAGLETNAAAILGGFLSMVGQTMIGLGTILVAASFFTAGASAGPGLALIGGGVAAVALGTALSASGKTSATPATPSIGGGSARPTPGFGGGGGFFGQDPFGARGPSETSTTIIIQGNAPLAFVGASEEEAGRTLAGMLGKAETLNGGGSPWGG